MNMLETLLEAARFLDRLDEDSSSAAPAAPTNAGAANHHRVTESNHHNPAESRGPKLKKERVEQDDLFCEEKMLVIDEEEPGEVNTIRPNGSYRNHQSQINSRNIQQQQQQLSQHLQQQQQQQHQQQQQQQQQQPSTSPHGVRGNVIDTTTLLVGQVSSRPGSASSVTYQQQSSSQTQQTNNNQFNHNFTNHNSNHSQNSSDYDSISDGRRSRTGPCVIRSGTREVHNKLEKNRRAHLKECFELLKKQLPVQEEKKSSNLSILHAAIRHIANLKKKEREFEHEMERLAREKIHAQQRIVALKKELSGTWDHIDFGTMLPEHNSLTESSINKNVALDAMDIENGSNNGCGLVRSGTRYSSTSSLSSAATAVSSHNNQHQPPSTSIASTNATNTNNSNNNNSNCATNATNISTHLTATAAVVTQTQGLNVAHASRDSPPTSCSPGASTPGAPTPAQEKVQTISASVVQQTATVAAVATTVTGTGPTTQLHLPISAQMLNATPGLATLVPTLQQLGPGLRVIPGDGRQLIAVQSSGPANGTACGTAEARPVALVVHSTTANNENRVTFVHSTSNDGRPLTFVPSTEARPIVIATQHASPINAQARIKNTDGNQATHKMVSSVTLVGSTGSELARLPGGAELNILPANGVFRSVKAQPLTVQGGLTLSHGVSLQSAVGKTTGVSSAAAQTNSSVSSSQPDQVQPALAGLTPIVTPMTVVSQGGGSQQVILAPTSLAGKVIGTPLLKSVSQGHLPLTAQYINSLVKPVVVVQQAQQPQQQPQAPNSNNTAASGTNSQQQQQSGV